MTVKLIDPLLKKDNLYIPLAVVDTACSPPPLAPVAPMDWPHLEEVDAN